MKDYICDNCNTAFRLSKQPAFCPFCGGGMDRWGIDKINEALTLLIKSNSAQLETTTITTQDERDELSKHYSAITGILLRAARQHIEKSNEREGAEGMQNNGNDQF